MYILINDVLFVIAVNTGQSINTLWHSVTPVKKMNRFWGIAQWLKHWTCKHEELCLYPCTHVNAGSVAQSACNPGLQRQRHYVWSKLAS